MESIELKFELHDEVLILPLELSGIIKSIWITETGIKYEARYFDNAEAKCVYFYPEELLLS